MKYIPNSVSRHVVRGALTVSKHSPTLLFAGGVTGVVGTTVLACKATLKLDAIFTASEKLKAENEVNFNGKKLEAEQRALRVATIQRVVVLYAPAAAVGVVSIAALTSSHRILTKRNAALSAAYSALAKGFSDYRKRVVNELGEEKDREFRYGVDEREVAVDTKNGPKVQTVKGPKDVSIFAKFFDQTCRQWKNNAEHNIYFLRAQQNYANDMLRARGHLFLNEVYDMLDIPRTQAGQVVGWVLEGEESDGFVDFGVFLDKGIKHRHFVNGYEGAILLDFNVDGPIHTLIGKRS